MKDILKFQSGLGHSMQQILRLLQLNLFERRDFMELFAQPKTVVAHLKLCDCSGLQEIVSILVLFVALTVFGVFGGNSLMKELEYGLWNN